MHRMATQAPTSTAWHTMTGSDVVAALDGDVERGLSASAVQRRLAEYGANSIPKEPPPSYFQVLFKALQDPMNLMLVAVAVASFLIGQTSTGIRFIGS